MPRLLRKNDTGDYWVQDDAGGLRSATAEEIGNAGVVDYGTMGVTLGERFVVKNFASNPAAARSYLRKKGYDVVQIGDSINFAVRKQGDAEWKMLDPKGFGKGGSDFFYDMLDLVADVGVGIATGAAATAGSAIAPGVGSIAGAGIGGGVAELARQGIGEALGLEGNMDPKQAALIGGVSAAVPLAGRAIGAAVRPVAKLGGTVADQLVGRVTGIKPLAGSTMRQTIEESRKFLKVYKTQFSTPGEVLEGMRAKITKLRTRQWIEHVDLEDIYNQHGGRKVNVDSFRQLLVGAKAVNRKTIFDQTAMNKAQSLMDEAEAIMGPIGQVGPVVKRITLDKAEQLRKIMSEVVDSVNGWTAKPKNVKQSWIRNFKQAYGALRNEMSGTLSGTGKQEEFDFLMNRIHLKSRSLRFMEKQFGAEVAPQTAERRVTNAFGKGSELYRDELKKFDGLFEDDWTGVLRSTTAASYVNPNPAEFGRPGIMPPFTATGGIFGASAIGGGAMLGGAPGALAGAALASPRVALPLHGALTGAASGIGRVASSPATRAASIAAMQAASRELFPTARNSGKPVVRMR